jgi:hypothetical protein
MFTYIKNAMFNNSTFYDNKLSLTGALRYELHCIKFKQNCRP